MCVVMIQALCLNLGISLLDHKNISKDEMIGCASLYMYSLFLSSFLCRFTWYYFILGQILFVYLYMFEMIGGCHVCRPFTIPPKTVGFSRTGVIHSETLP